MDEKEYSKKMEKEDMDAYYSLALSTSNEETLKAFEFQSEKNS